MPPTFTFGKSVWSFTDPTFQYFFILATVALCFWLMHRLIAQPARQGIPRNPRQ